jgi:acyl carrier protein
MAVICGADADFRATFFGLTQPSDGRAGAVPDQGTPAPDRFERDTIDIIRRLGRRPVEPSLSSELMADLGFDSLLVLELVGELEDHFGIAIPLNALTHIRTVAQVAAEIRKLVAEQERGA